MDRVKELEHRPVQETKDGRVTRCPGCLVQWARMLREEWPTDACQWADGMLGRVVQQTMNQEGL